MATYQDSKGTYFKTRAEAAASNTALGTNPSVKNINTGVIPVDNLQQKEKPLDLMETPTSNFSDLESLIGGAFTSSRSAAEKYLAEDKQTNDSALQSYLKEVIAGGNIESSIDRTEQNVAKKRSDELTSMLEQEQLTNRRKIEELRKNERGLFGGALEQEVERLNRESLSKQADIAIQLSAANRQYDTAAAIADRQVELKTQQSKARADALRYFYESNKADFNKQEERIYDSIAKEADKKYQEEKATQTLALTIQQNQAPQSITNLVNNAKSVKDIMSIPGISKYLLSQADRLDIAIKSETLQEKRNAAEAAKIAKEQGLITAGQAEKATEIRKEYNQLEPVKSLDKSETDTKAILNALKGGKPTDDIAAINSFQRIAVDPGVSVKEGDVALLQTANNFGDKAWLRTNGFMSGNKLTPAARQAMQDLVLKIHDSRIGSAVEKTAPLRATAKVYGIDFDNYIATPKKNSQTILEEVTKQQVTPQQRASSYISNLKSSYGGSVIGTPFDNLFNQ